MTSRLPFHHLKYDSAVILTVMKHGRPPRENSPEITDDIWSALERCWNEDPQARPSMASLALFFDITHALSSTNRHLAESEITQLLSPDTVATSPKFGTSAVLSRIRSLGRSALSGAERPRQRQGQGSSDTGERTRRRFSLPMPGRISKKQEDQPASQSSRPYRCNWTNCSEGFDTLGECQTHEFGHRKRWELVGV
jgi:hypothetical protein